MVKMGISLVNEADNERDYLRQQNDAILSLLYRDVNINKLNQRSGNDSNQQV